MGKFQGHTAKLTEFANERQGKRLLRMSFPRQPGPKGALMLVNKLDCSESMSRGWRCQLEVLSDSARIRLRELSGKMVTVSMVRDDGSLRHFNGYVHEFALVKTDGGFAFYRMVLLPWLADLALRSDCATFMNMDTGELLRRIFGHYDRRDFMTRIAHPDPDVTMRIQYNETDYNHLHRRLEADGWHTWIEHFADHHTVWIGDDSTQAAPIDGARPEMVFRGESGSAEGDGIARWSPARRVGAALASVGSYDFKCADSALGERWSLNPRGALPDYEAFESTGAYGFKQDGRAGEELAKLRMEERDARGLYFRAAGNERRAQPGRWFTLAGHFSGERRPYNPREAIPPGEPDDPAARQYLILSVRHVASNNYHVEGGAPSSYSNTFKCVRKNTPWRPGRGYHSRDTRIPGPQTALVVGPSNEHIFTDKHGRVCVRFHWDRESKRTRDLSAWVRVMTPWAGNHFGQISLPRINDEVVVVFLEGNCDRPLIIGSAYNASRMPPWELPANRTQSGILSRSTPNGTAANANALRFEDKKDHEEVWLHAEKDQRIEVEHDESHTVGNDRGKTVDRDETNHVGRDRSDTVGHDEKITVHNNRSERVDHNEDISIGDNRSEHVGGDETLKVDGHQSERVALTKQENIGLGKSLLIGAGYQTTVLGLMNTSVGLTQLEEVGLTKTVIVGQSSELTAMVEHKITVGTSVVTITPTRIVMEADEILIRGRNKVEIHGDDIDNNPG